MSLNFVLKYHKILNKSVGLNLSNLVLNEVFQVYLKRHIIGLIMDEGWLHPRNGDYGKTTAGFTTL